MRESCPSNRQLKTAFSSLCSLSLVLRSRSHRCFAIFEEEISQVPSFTGRHSPKSIDSLGLTLFEREAHFQAHYLPCLLISRRLTIRRNYTAWFGQELRSALLQPNIGSSDLDRALDLWVGDVFPKAWNTESFLHHYGSVRAWEIDALIAIRLGLTEIGPIGVRAPSCLAISQPCTLVIVCPRKSRIDRT